MSEPQLENGYTRIANELLEQFAKINLSKYEWRILWVVIRKTYGWSKAKDVVSVSQITEMTGLDRRNASRAKKSLVQKNIINEINGMIAINKDSSSWFLSSVQTTASIVYRDTRPEAWRALRVPENPRRTCAAEDYQGRCEWCQDLFTYQDRALERHHIVPREQGGLAAPKGNKTKYELPNVAILCALCHKKAHEKMNEWLVVNSDDTQGWYRHFVSLLSSAQTHFLSSVETPQKKDKNKYKRKKTIGAFDEAWSNYPRRAGGNSKRDAMRSWNARLEEGHTTDEILQGVKRYHDYCQRTGKIGTEYVKQAKTFFGPSKHFLEPWDPPPQPRSPNQPTTGKIGRALTRMKEVFGDDAFGDTGIDGQPGDDVDAGKTARLLPGSG